MFECKVCKDLNEEKEKMTTDTIKLQQSGYYGYYMPIYHCPVCGKRLDKYKDYSVEQLINGIV